MTNAKEVNRDQGKSSAFPCPLCGDALEIRQSVKGKPYMVCDFCGMQMFIRKNEGISALASLPSRISKGSNIEADKLQKRIKSLEDELSKATEASRDLCKTRNNFRLAEDNLEKMAASLRKAHRTLADLENVALRTCPKCNEKFPIRENLIQTSWFDGRFQGFRCPNGRCAGLVGPRQEI